MFLTVNTEFLTMLMASLARDADALGSIKIEVGKLEKSSQPNKVILKLHRVHNEKYFPDL